MDGVGSGQREGGLRFDSVIRKESECRLERRFSQAQKKGLTARAVRGSSPVYVDLKARRFLFEDDTQPRTVDSRYVVVVNLTEFQQEMGVRPALLSRMVGLT